MKSPDAPEPEFLIGCRALAEYINELLAPARFSEDAVYRLADKRRKRPAAGKVFGQLIAPPRQDPHVLPHARRWRRRGRCPATMTPRAK